MGPHTTKTVTLSFYSPNLHQYIANLINEMGFWNERVFIEETNKIIDHYYQSCLVEGGVHYSELVDDELAELRLIHHLITEVDRYVDGSLLKGYSITKFHVMSIHGHILTILD